MKSWFLFEKNTGHIESKLSCPESMLPANLKSKPHLDFVESDGNPKQHFVDVSDQSVQPKVDSPATLSGATLSNLPLPCTVTMRGPASAEAYVEQDGLTLDADVPGRYRVTVVADHPKYYDAEFEVNL